MNYTLREVRESDLPYLASNLRTADIREFYGSYGHLDVSVGIRASCLNSDQAIIGADTEDKPIVAFGVRQVSPKCALIWAFGTPAVQRYRIAFIRTSRRVIQGWFEDLPEVDYFFNFTHSENTLHHKWLEWCGAQLLPAVPWGTTGENFRPFVIRRTSKFVI